MKTAQQAAENWRNSSGRAQQAFTDGVNGYSGDWAASTIRQEAVALQNITRAFADGTWRAGVQRTGTNGWKSRTQAKAANYGVGFTAGADRQSRAIQKVMGALGNLVPNLPPRGDFNQNVTRATTLMQGMHALRGQLGAD